MSFLKATSNWLQYHSACVDMPSRHESHLFHDRTTCCLSLRDLADIFSFTFLARFQYRYAGDLCATHVRRAPQRYPSMFTCSHQSRNSRQRIVPLNSTFISSKFILMHAASTAPRRRIPSPVSHEPSCAFLQFPTFPKLPARQHFPRRSTSSRSSGRQFVKIDNIGTIDTLPEVQACQSRYKSPNSKGRQNRH